MIAGTATTYSLLIPNDSLKQIWLFLFGFPLNIPLKLISSS